MTRSRWPIPEATQEQTVPLTAEQLEKWLTETVAEAYHGAAGANPHHDFPECGDPFCTDAQRNLAAILEAYKAGRDGLDPERLARAMRVTRRVYFVSKGGLSEHEDGKWYVGPDDAWAARLLAAAYLATPSDTPKEPTL